jgi:hypothetical protein
MPDRYNETQVAALREASKAIDASIFRLNAMFLDPSDDAAESPEFLQTLTSAWEEIEDELAPYQQR